MRSRASFGVVLLGLMVASPMALACNHQCDYLGEKKCGGGGVQTCLADGSGCRYWSSATSCNDGVSCTVDGCSGGVCSHQQHNSLCDDGNVCSEDVCTASGCTYAVKGGSCNDKDLCTLNDFCVGGVCKGTPITCTDGNPCTLDVCSGGGCSYPPGSGPCDDGNSCTINDSCSGGSCSGTPKPCGDGNPCTADSCSQGGCLNTPVSGSCSDGNPCTGPDSCSGGTCQGTPKSCSDGNPCTLDSCQSGICKHAPKVCADGNACTTDSCVGGSCTFTNNTLPCSDGSACTTGDSCGGGSCKGGPTLNCNDGKQCTNDGCHPASGCTHTPRTGACNDGNPCTTSDACAGGLCLGGPAPSCDDGNACTNDTCVAGVGCTHPPNALPCDDGKACTAGDTCAGGACQGTPTVDCDDGVACTIDSCNEADGGCQHLPQNGACDDSDPCTADVCNAASGCSHPAQAGACDDGDLCTSGETCQAGGCNGGVPIDCDDGNPCTTASCAPTTGCDQTDNSAPCDDGEPCTVGEVCTGGACGGGATTDCDDANACTTDACVEGGGCTHTPTGGACDDGSACTLTDACEAGVCVGAGAPDCDDDNPCTADGCDATAGCWNVEADGAPCTDGNPCTLGDSCASGLCLPGGPWECDDAVDCTADSCDPTVGCTHTPNDTLCDDDIGCTEDECLALDGCSSMPNDALCATLGPCDAPSCDVGAGGCEHIPDPELCGDAPPCVAQTCDDTYACQSAPKDCDDDDPCTTDACDPATSGCEHQKTDGCCVADADCGSPPDGCGAMICAGGQCKQLPCIAGDVCVLGGCRKVCVPPKETTKCSDDGDTLFQCLTDQESGLSGWIPSACDAEQVCCFNGDIQEFWCNTPSCDDKECGSPTACMVPCGACQSGWTCAGPNEALSVDGSHPDAFTCVPGCAAANEKTSAQVEIPECGEPLPGTVGIDTCPVCPNATICYDGGCLTQCDASGLTAAGRCVEGEAQWCDGDLPQSTDCAAEGSYCCTAADPQNDGGSAGCCSCALECEAKAWECGTNTCGDLCGVEDSVDGCPAGYDCQGRACVCTTPELCEDNPAPPPRADAGDGDDVITSGAGRRTPEHTAEQDDSGDSGGCGACRAGGPRERSAPNGAVLLFGLLLLGLTVRR